MFKKIIGFFRNVQQLGKFTRLVHEVNGEFSPQYHIKLDKVANNKRDPLQELTALMVTRPSIVSVLDEFDVAYQDRQSELVKLFHILIINGAGQWVADEFVPTAVLYDVELLRLILKLEKSNVSKSGSKMAILALNHIENRNSSKVA